MKQKKIPMRKCMGCNVSKPKKELIRVVKVAQKLLDEGKMIQSICIDAKGKISGRGAYICPDANCLRAARKTKKLEREFEMKISEEVYDSLEEILRDEIEDIGVNAENGIK